jgi:hypothetical protein
MSDDLRPIGDFMPAEYRDRAPVVLSPDQMRMQRQAENDYLWQTQQRQIPYLLKRRGCPAVLVDRIASGYLDPTEPLEVAERWEREKQPLLVLAGGTRRGKSLAAVWLMGRRREHVRINVPGDKEINGDLMWCHLTHFEEHQAFVGPDALVAAKAANWSDEAKDWTRLIRATFLVIDDLGRELSAIDTALTKLLQYRLEGNRATVLTTNMTLAEMRPAYGDRLADRINEVGLAFDCGPSQSRTDPAHG